MTPGEAALPPLFRAWPELAKNLPRLSLGDYPTPVQKLEGLGHENLWIKREDLSSPLYGGNKVRKLEFVLADALARRCDRVITMGGIGTNHGLATAIFCREAGLACRLLLFTQPVNEYVKRNLLLFARYGAELRYLKGVIRTGASLIITQRLLHPRSYILEAGGSSPLGTVGVVNAVFELKEQIDAGLMPVPKYIFCPLGSNGTMAGLALGALLAGLPSRVIGVRVTMDAIGPMQIANRHTVEKLMKRTCALMKKLCPSLPAVEIPRQEVLDGYVGEGYGCATAPCLEALSLMKERAGILLDPTYTAKTFAAVCDFIRMKEHAGDAILYWHTYNSADLGCRAAEADCRDLPEELREILEEK
jgi:D-cysteine desulfhydrase